MTPEAMAATTAPDQAPIAFGSAATIAGTSSQLSAGPGDAKLPVAPPRRRGGLVVLLALLVLGGGAVAYVLVTSGKKQTAAKQSVATESGSGSAGGPVATPVDAQLAPTAIDAVAMPTSVFITIENAPKGTQVLRNGKVVGFAPKIEVTYGTEEVPFVLQAPSYDPAPLVVVPDDNKTVSVKMTKTKSRTHTIHTHEQQEPDPDSVESPFTKHNDKAKD
jgi:hypothetical protein